MKSPIAVLLAAGLGTILGVGVTAALGVRDAIYNCASFDDPVYVAAKRNISTSYKELGNAWLALDPNAARNAYGQSLQIDLFIDISCPKESANTANLAYTYGKMGEAALALGDYPEATDSFQKGVKLLESLEREAKANAEQQEPWPLIVSPTLLPEGFTTGRDLVQRWLTTQRRNLRVCRETGHARQKRPVAVGG